MKQLMNLKKLETAHLSLLVLSVFRILQLSLVF